MYNPNPMFTLMFLTLTVREILRFNRFIIILPSPFSQHTMLTFETLMYFNSHTITGSVINLIKNPTFQHMFSN